MVETHLTLFMRIPLDIISLLLVSHLPSPSLLGILYAISEIILGLTKRSGPGSVSRDRYSLLVLWIIIALSIFLAFFSLTSPVGRFPHPHAWAIAGLFFFIGGVALRWSSIFYLGRLFTVDVAISSHHELIDTGPYRFIRHPSYTGALLAFLGFGLSLGSWLAVSCLLLPVTAAFLWRIRVEENALSEALGQSYRQYILRTKRLVPFVY